MPNTKKTDVNVEHDALEGQPLVIHLEGLGNIAEADAQNVATQAALKAVEAIDAKYADRITTLEADKRDMKVKLEAAEQERDALKAEKAERLRREAFDAMFAEFAIPEGDREELYTESFAGMEAKAARPVLKLIASKSTVKAKKEDDDIPASREKESQALNAESFGLELAGLDTQGAGKAN